jgi:hypothetical protein
MDQDYKPHFLTEEMGRYRFSETEIFLVLPGFAWVILYVVVSWTQLMADF